MRLLIHDLEESAFQQIFPNLDPSIQVIHPDQKAHHCTGCFGCWIKTPGTCVLPDLYQQMGTLFAQSSEVLAISQCCFGGYSPTVKKAIERCISYLLPYFELRKNEIHHVTRYQNQLRMTVRFYGESITAEEKAVAEQLVAANGLNLRTSETSIRFYNSIEEMRGESL